MMISSLCESNTGMSDLLGSPLSTNQQLFCGNLIAKLISLATVLTPPAPTIEDAQGKERATQHMPCCQHFVSENR